MIVVNLLPYHLRPIKRTPLPHLLSAVVLIVVAAAVVMVYLGNKADIAQQRALLAKHKQELEQLQPVIEEYNALVEQKQQLADKLTTIDEIVSDRIIWSRQLWNLSRLLPKNMWYDKMLVDYKTIRERRTTMNPDTKQPETKDVTIKRPVMTVEGYAIEDENQKIDVAPILLQLDSDEEFARIFELDRTDFEDTKFDGYPVRWFSLEYYITPGGQAE